MAAKLENLLLYQIMRLRIQPRKPNSNWISSEHAPYSPDMVPLDFALFPTLTGQLRGTRFDGLARLRRQVQKVVSSLDEQWFNNVFRSWVRWHENWGDDCNGLYFEKK